LGCIQHQESNIQKVDAKYHAYVEKLSQIESTDAKQFLDSGHRRIAGRSQKEAR
jgi:hypothetical protein